MALKPGNRFMAPASLGPRSPLVPSLAASPLSRAGKAADLVCSALRAARSVFRVIPGDPVDDTFSCRKDQLPRSLSCARWNLRERRQPRRNKDDQRFGASEAPAGELERRKSWGLRLVVWRCRMERSIPPRITERMVLSCHEASLGMAEAAYICISRTYSMALGFGFFVWSRE